MTSVRPYRSEVGHDAGVRAIEELQRGAGSRYDPIAIDAFARMFEQGRLEWILHHFNDASAPEFKVVSTDGLDSSLRAIRERTE